MLSRNGVVAIIILIVSLGLYGAHKWIVHDKVAQAEAVMKFSYDQQLLNAQLKAGKITDELRINASNLEKDKNAKIAAISADRDAAFKRLRERPNRPTNYSPPPVVTASCSGRELYQEDGLFLRGEAARAEQLIVERDYYYEQYENARKKLNGE